jgi:HAD superfamily hydrolase (TIGR01450 family)
VGDQDRGWLREQPEPLSSAYDVALLDLDGVVYVGRDAVPGVPEELRLATERGQRLVFATNNASRTPQDVAAHLTRLGIQAGESDVVTSAQAVSGLLAERLGPGGRVFLMGGAGLEAALTERGLVPVHSLDDDPAAVVSGYHPDLRWWTVVQASILVDRGVPWYASNTDMTIPTGAGLGPGNGALVETVARFSGRRPVVAGKPEPTLFEECVRRMSARTPLVVGDRLDTDIEGAVRASMPSLLVLTGVTGLEELVRAGRNQRPTYVATTLASLHRAQPAVRRSEDGWSVGGWVASVVDGRAEVHGDGDADDWWRALAEAAWAHLDATGGEPDVSGLVPPG